MKRTMAVSLCVFLMLASCGKGASTRLDDVEKSNEDLGRRVKALEDELLATDKKMIQHEQALRQMAERIRDMENIVNRIQMGPAR